ncbi:LutC/YkgG family protein [Lacticaseibacillus sp. GG6-2]
MTDNREAFLNAIAEKSGRPRHQLEAHPFEPINDLPETTLADKTPEELLALAKTNSEAVHVTFDQTTLAGLPAKLTAFLQAKQAQSVILPQTEAFDALPLADWQAALTPSPTYWQVGASREVNLATAQAADAAIGMADFLLAESGTITVATQPGQGRAFHFLPTHYLSIIPQSRIVARSRQAMNWYDTQLKSGNLTTSNINFITGPSNSGDIEMVLVVGVHGPLDMTYLVVADL